MKMMYKDNAENEVLEIAKPQRLNPASIYFNLVKIIKETILGLSAGLIITIKQSMFYFLIFVGVFLLFLIISSILSWIRFTYRVENDELRDRKSTRLNYSHVANSYAVFCVINKLTHKD